MLNPRPSRGFTVIEVMLALALSSIVLAAAISLYQVLQVSDRNAQARFEQAADLAVTQITLRKIMNTLMAAPAVPANAVPNPARQPNLDEEGADDEEIAAGEGATSGVIEAVPAAGTRVMFDLWWEEYDVDTGLIELPVMELVVTEPPIALRSAAEKIDEEMLEDIDESLTEEALRRTDRLAESVRARLEVVGADDGWRLYWRPIDPPARPFMLLSKIGSLPDGNPNIAWKVLSRDDSVEEWGWTWTATLRPDFPLAVQLSVVGEDGRLIDWMFETHVSVPE